MKPATMMAILGSLLAGLGAAPILAAEDVIEHDTYEKRTWKVETGKVLPTTTTPPPSRTYEHHESEETTIEKKSAPTAAPAPTVKERTTESVETKEQH